MANEKEFFENNDIKIIKDDVLSTEEIKNGEIDLIVTSPPYNVDIKYSSHNDQITYEEYLKFSKKWLTQCFDWLKDDGRICLNIPLDKNKGGQQSVGADLTSIAKEIGYKYHSTIIWNEGNISRRTAWGSWLSASAPYVIAPVELIVILYKKNWKKISGSKKSDIERKEFIEWTNGMWTFKGESKKRIGHPAPFPVELPRRCIKLFSYVDDVILDPFMGSGTTLIAAYLNNRKSIGIEFDINYCNLAKNRLIKDAHILNKRLNEIKKEHTEADIENGQTLCAQHNFQKKYYKQTETGKRMFIRLYELARKSNDRKLMAFCEQILEVYENNDINGHIVWKS